MINYNKYFDFDKRTIELIDKAEKSALSCFKEAEDISGENQLKVLSAFKENKVSEAHFMPTSGYGYDDLGRDTLDKVYADVFKCEDALVRHNIISGTHALSLCLFGVLRPGDNIIGATGKPYDTLEETIGLRGSLKGSLKDFNIDYKQVELKDDMPDIENIINAIDNKTKAVLIQRSKGYDFRKSLSISDIEDLIKSIRTKKEDIIAIVDNCYGEFVEEREPTEVGADLVAGSLIKNPGGSIASTGGYIAGKKNLIELCSYKLNAVGIGKECGPSLGMNKSMYQGFYFAPFIVLQAVKSAILASHLFSDLGFSVNPAPYDKRTCIIEAIKFEREDALLRFCEGIQKGAAVDSFVTPVPWDMPGYNCKVIMAAGAFNQGSSIELSADGPIKPPHIAYFQGGVTYDYGKLGIMFALDNLIKNKIV